MKGRGAILGVLREKTRAEHQAIEASLAVLMSQALTREAYEEVLKRFYGFYASVEHALARTIGLDGAGIALEPRAKAPLLAIDLRFFQVDPMIVPRCADHVRVDSVAAALGSMYVLEGASLGGQIISRRLRTTIGVTPETGGRFFHGYGERTGEMWSAFGEALSAYSSRERQTERQIVEAAKATFRDLRGWCEAR
jgi:heme oxygenase